MHYFLYFQDILNNSDHQAVLQLVNLVAGQYIFSLTVKDSEGLSNKDTASLVVKGDNHAIDKLELLLEADIKSFTTENKVGYHSLNEDISYTQNKKRTDTL